MGNTFRPGLYLHIPFCQSKCGYCDFYSVTDLSLRTDFINALKNEIAIYADKASKEIVFDTIYIGGGTPSLLTPGETAEILNIITRSFTIDPGAEITLEINPGTADLDKLRDFRSAGINRLSLGIQSFSNTYLQLLQRIHTAEQAREVIINSRKAGYLNLGLDFIYGLPGQSRQDWQQTLRSAIEYQPEHISAYSLIIEPDTPFYWKKQNGELRIPGDDRVADYFKDTREILCAAQYNHYEISNYSRSDDFKSRHNSKYWDHTPYLGFGPSAHSFWQNCRWGNQRSLIRYIRNLNANLPATAFREELDDSQLITEHIMLALRTDQGICISKFNARYNLSFLDQFHSTIIRLTASDYGRIAEDRFYLTEKGMLVCDEITLAFSK